jgi:hypothetical protein
LLAEWTRENLAIRQFMASSRVNFTTAFYDELAGSPERAFADLCNKLGCQFDKQALRYWEKVHHGFAANGATSPLFASARNKCEFIVTCDDPFYETNGRCSFVDQRWREQLLVTEKQAIREDSDAVSFLNLYDRVLTSCGLLKLSKEERSTHRSFEGRFIQSLDAGPQAEKIFIVKSGRRHWITSMQVLERISEGRIPKVEIVPADCLERIPMAEPITH